MFRRVALRAPVLALPLLAALAGCQDTGDPLGAPRPQFAQGDNGTWTVNSLLDPGTGGCDDAECTLREAIAAAASGDRIEFAAGLQGDVQLTAGQLQIIDKSVAIDGDGRVGVDAQGNSAVLTVGNTTNVKPVIALAGLALKNAGTQLGGGINVGGVTLTLDHVDVLDNATGTTGGGLSLRNGPQGVTSNVTIRNSRIARNIAAGDGGGGIALVQGAELTLINSTVDSNTTPEYGGGILNDGTLTVIGSLIAGNEGASAGAIKPGQFSSTTLVRSTISGNRSASGVGGINGGGPSWHCAA
jgi:CSLREA domain-containing protein